MLDREVGQGHLAGAIMLIQHRGKPVYYEAFGVRDPATMAPMTTDTIFRLYSMSKPVTSVAAMILVEQGKLRLDDPIAKFIPSFAHPQVATERTDASGKSYLDFAPAEKPITVLDLMRQSSGISSAFTNLVADHAALSRCGPVRRRFRQCRFRGAACETAAGLSAGHGVGLRPFDRFARPHHRDRLGPVAVRFPEAVSVRSAGHDRHRLLRARSRQSAAHCAADANRPHHRQRDHQRSHGEAKMGVRRRRASSPPRAITRASCRC